MTRTVSATTEKLAGRDSELVTFTQEMLPYPDSSSCPPGQPTHGGHPAAAGPAEDRRRGARMHHGARTIRSPLPAPLLPRSNQRPIQKPLNGPGKHTELRNRTRNHMAE
eukprot:217586-Hanusia_phi.AAC.3